MSGNSELFRGGFVKFGIVSRWFLEIRGGFGVVSVNSGLFRGGFWKFGVVFHKLWMVSGWFRGGFGKFGVVSG